MQDRDHQVELKVRDFENRMMQFVASMQVPRVLRHGHSLGRYIIRSIRNDKHVTYVSCLYVTTLYDYVTSR